MEQRILADIKGRLNKSALIMTFDDHSLANVTGSLILLIRCTSPAKSFIPANLLSCYELPRRLFCDEPHARHAAVAFETSRNA